MVDKLPLVPQIYLGNEGLIVSLEGLGCMGMSAFYGPPKPEEEMIELIRYAIEAGVTFLDTAEIYGPYTNEILVGKAIKGIPREKLQIATKFGLHPETWTVRGDPEYIRQAIEGSLKRLDTPYIDLYYQHRIDPKVPIEVSVRTMKEFVDAGKVKYIGLSEASAADIRRAHAVHPITAVQIEYSLWSRDVEEDVIPTCTELGIGIVPYSPLGRGFFSGLKTTELSESDFRKTNPRFTAENYEKNKAFFERLVELGKKKKATPGQLALSWVIQSRHGVSPIPGTTKKANLEENIGAVAVKLSEAEVKEIEEAVPHEEVAGDRYLDMKSTWRFTTTPPLESWVEK